MEKGVPNSANAEKNGSSIFLDPFCSFIKNSSQYLDCYKNVRSQRFFQRMAVCDLLKNDGNCHFKSGNFKRATELYEQVKFSFFFVLNYFAFKELINCSLYYAP